MHTKRSNSKKRKSKLNLETEETNENESDTLPQKITKQYSDEQHTEVIKNNLILRQQLQLSNPENCTVVAGKSSECFRETPQCEKCGKHFFSKISLDRHISRFHIADADQHSSSGGKQEIDITGNTSKKSQPTGNQKFECGVCSVKFSLANSLRRHQRKFHTVFVGIPSPAIQNHFEDENEENICIPKGKQDKTDISVPNITDESSSDVCRENDVNENKKSKKIKTLECAKCQVVCSTKKSLIFHIRLFHTADISRRRPIDKIFKCSRCPVTFACSNSLRRHERHFHPCPEQKLLDDRLWSSRTIACSKCSAMFTQKCNLRRHERNFHFDPSVHIKERKPIGCAHCKTTFSVKSALVKHMRNFHPNTIEGKIVRKTVQCSRCPVRFSRKTNLHRHEKKFHPEKYEPNSARKPVQCPICKESCGRKIELLVHFGSAHDIKLHDEVFTFENEAEFKKWKVSVEEGNRCNYMIRHSVSYDGYKKVILRCSRSGYYEVKAHNRQRRLKEKGSKKINGYCPAEMNVKIFSENGSVLVNHQATHVGHSKELKYMDLNEKERNIIINTLASGVPVTSLLEQIRINPSTPLEERRRLHLISKKEIRNVAHRAGVFNTSSKIRIKEDPMCVEDWVLMNDHFVLYFKLTGALDDKFPCLREEDFVIIIMTNSQHKKLLLHGNNVLYFDSTHGANQYHFQLSALMVLNEMEKEYPCAFMFSNKMDEEFYNVFVECIREKVPMLKPEIMMTDMTESFYEAWAQIMPEPKFRLYCTWHVLKDWRANLTKIQLPDKRKPVMKSLEDLLYLMDEESFKTELDTFLELVKGYEDFQKYFMEEYLLKRSPKCWAYCYRYMANVKLSMNLEAFHKNIKHRVHGGKNVKFLEEALLGLEKYLTEKEHEDVLVQEGCIQPPSQIAYKLRILKKRHQAIGNINVDNIECLVENGVWLLSTSTTMSTEKPKIEEISEQNVITIFSISKTDSNCKVYDCILKCDECDCCIHSFKCSCEDSSIKENMCQHIHLVCQYIKSHTHKLLPAIVDPKVTSDTVVASEPSSKISHDSKASPIPVLHSIYTVPFSFKKENFDITSPDEVKMEDLVIEETVDEVEAQFAEIFKEIRKNPDEKRLYLNVLKKTAIAFNNTM